MEHGRDEENENIIQDMIHDGRDDDVVSSFLNESGEGVEELDQRDGSGADRDGSGADGSGAGTTKSGEVY